MAGEDESAFVRVHDNNYLSAAKRLYMTATPRIYDDTSKAKAGQANAILASMDDESIFGPEFYRLGFGEAVSKGLLTDYKVLVLAVDEEQVSRAFQLQLADDDSELRLDDVAKIVGCWNGLGKRQHPGTDFGADDAPMTRAVAFAGTIKDSQKFARLFGPWSRTTPGRTIPRMTMTNTPPLGARSRTSTAPSTYWCATRSSTGSRPRRLPVPAAAVQRPVPVRGRRRSRAGRGDVPQPTQVVVDVVQSVGRVMRKAPGKQYGYIILPVGIPAGLTPEEALGDNKKYQVVWEVLQALRAHDERFNAMINKIDLTEPGTTGSSHRRRRTGGDSNSPGAPSPHVQDALLAAVAR